MITLKTPPVPINQKYGVYRGRMLLQAKYRNTKEALALEMRSQINHAPLEEELVLSVMIYLGTKRKTDIDAFLKILMDAGEGVLYENDNQVTELHIYKHYNKENPRVELEYKKILKNLNEF